MEVPSMEQVQAGVKERWNGFEKDLEEVLKQHMEWSGEGRNIHAGKEVLK